MTLITRLIRLCKADLHGLLDSLEEPEEVIKQAIRDMDEDIATQERQLEQLRAVWQRLEREAQQTTATIQEIASQIDICFAAENEPLARHLLRKRLEMVGRAKAIAQAQDETRAQSDALVTRIAMQKAQLARVVQKLRAYEATRLHQPWASSPCVPLQGSSVVTDEEVEVAFLEEKRRRSAAAPGMS